VKESAGLIRVKGGKDTLVDIEVAADGQWVRLELENPNAYDDKHAYFTPDEARFLARKLNRMAKLVETERAST
jgi:hypothetical protein